MSLLIPIVHMQSRACRHSKFEWDSSIQSCFKTQVFSLKQFDDETLIQEWTSSHSVVKFNLPIRKDWILYIIYI